MMTVQARGGRWCLQGRHSQQKQEARDSLSPLEQARKPAALQLATAVLRSPAAAVGAAAAELLCQHRMQQRRPGRSHRHCPQANAAAQERQRQQPQKQPSQRRRRARCSPARKQRAERAALCSCSSPCSPPCPWLCQHLQPSLRQLRPSRKQRKQPRLQLRRRLSLSLSLQQTSQPYLPYQRQRQLSSAASARVAAQACV